jgi:2-C-methyl-D-erythritol 4-phosphate cytidylyltransferase/2-C-methyl-D-erythritol 2,4-cyclodiphosphate synthase
MKAGCVLLCAGMGSRMGENKMLLKLRGKSVLRRALEAVLESGCFERIALVVSEDTRREAQRCLEELNAGERCCLCPGGETRAQSVVNGLRTLREAEYVAVHDGARCLVRPELFRAALEQAQVQGSAVTALPMTDTVKTAEEGLVRGTLCREKLWTVQTPQCFSYRELLDCYELALAAGETLTDEASALELCGKEVRLLPGCRENIKLTTRQDLQTAEAILARREGQSMRIGYGEDTHVLTPGRELILGGVKIPHPLGLLGHSDADVLAHAAADAVLGALALGDIGKHFPDSDPAYQGADSLKLLAIVATMAKEQGYSLGNLDCTVIAEKPKLFPYIEKMRRNLAAALECPFERISVKASTSEGLGFEGRQEGITARCIVLLEG